MMETTILDVNMIVANKQLLWMWITAQNVNIFNPMYVYDVTQKCRKYPYLPSSSFNWFFFRKLKI